MRALQPKPTPSLPPVVQPSGDGAPHIRLTRKELEVMRWAMLGKSSWEIARILDCTESAVNYHFANIRVKFNVSSRWVALRQAAQMGLVKP
ncbi:MULTISPECIES: helix-turn-helix transcriptional regulator [Pseudomonas]|uniref:DNA-binding protein with HTH domain n=1 Tax=Pseudomonas asplenii TaxID=53407 RepID=A0A0M9GGK5_9PSED|nr:helix-turn-helix domain-containing protein [Pseudomonas fuscovaginae]KPA90688.1 DNA-binding protein with HTH domain [Pseudomonas fuscovaginae]KPA97217.1 DNA-binding protein with HTH domain [Pseudomonas fuscovaginae]